MDDSRLPDLPRTHRQHSVADHEILLSFNGDSDAAAWYDWWTTKGEKAFAAWLERQEKKG